MASAALDIDITISASLPDAQQTKEYVGPLLSSWLDANKAPKFQDPTGQIPSILPNPYFGALLGALALVPKVGIPPRLLIFRAPTLQACLISLRRPVPPCSSWTPPPTPSPTTL